MAVQRFGDAEAATARWESERSDHDAALAAEAGGGPPAGPAPAGSDPGAHARRSAERSADDIRGDLKAAERAVEQRLGRAGDDAPDEPGFWDKAFSFGKEFVGGAAEAAWAWPSSPSKLTPVYALADPDGYVDNLMVTAGANHRATPPAGTVVPPRAGGSTAPF